jgi:hypothetical protein
MLSLLKCSNDHRASLVWWVGIAREPTAPFRATTVLGCKWLSKVEGRAFYSQVVERKEPSGKWDPSTDPGCQCRVASRLALANWLAVVPANYSGHSQARGRTIPITRNLAHGDHDCGNQELPGAADNGMQESGMEIDRENGQHFGERTGGGMMISRRPKGVGIQGECSRPK